jgi:two-component system alkaline phosphatase synthesis response regulator PhoP
MMKSNIKILVVDDEPYICDVMRRILEIGGYRVTTASSGKTALELVKEDRPDVALLDLMMPGMDGREICRRVREIAPETRIIYFTGKVEFDTSQSKILSREADAVILKPATSKIILSTISKVLEDTRK